MLKGFRNFLMQGELIVIAVGLVVALAFSTLIKSFTDSIITPLVNAVEGGGATAISTVNVSDSTIENNFYGVCTYVSGALILRSSTIAGSTNAGIYSAGSGVTWVTRSTINGNNPGILLPDGGTAYSFGDNNLFGNGPNGDGADNGSFTSTQQYK